MLRTIKICTGPGCRAWDAEYMARQLKDMDIVSMPKIVKCMDKCGGGVSVRLKDRGKVFKLREKEDLINLVNGEESSLTQAY